jgi:hypothetical protein
MEYRVLFGSLLQYSIAVRGYRLRSFALRVNSAPAYG